MGQVHRGGSIVFRGDTYHKKAAPTGLRNLLGECIVLQRGRPYGANKSRWARRIYNRPNLRPYMGNGARRNLDLAP